MPTPMFIAAAALAAGVALGSQEATSAGAEIERVRAALTAGDTGAVAIAEEAAARFPRNAELLMWLGHAYRRTGELNAAAGAYRRAAALDPDHPEILMGQATLRATVGDTGGAVELYERAVRVAPSFSAAWRAAAELHMQGRNHARAIEYFDGYLEREPGDPEARYLYGVTLFFAGRHDDAITTLEESRELFPDAVSFRYALGVVLADRPEDHGRALEHLEAAAAADFERTEATYLIGRIRADTGDIDGAILAFREAIELSPDHLDAHYRLAQTLAGAGRRAEARPVMERFNELQQEFNARETQDKQLGAASNALAAAINDGDGDAALAAVDDLLALAPDDPNTLVAAAKVWISWGDESQAFDALEAASQIAPDAWEANYLYGLLLTRQNRFGDALEPLRRSVEANPLFADAHVIRGNALMRLGSPSEAASAYLAAIELESDNPGYWLNLAAAYETLGQVEMQRRAAAEYHRLLNDQSTTRQQ